MAIQSSGLPPIPFGNWAFSGAVTDTDGQEQDVDPLLEDSVRDWRRFAELVRCRDRHVAMGPEEVYEAQQQNLLGVIFLQTGRYPEVEALADRIRAAGIMCHLISQGHPVHGEIDRYGISAILLAPLLFSSGDGLPPSFPLSAMVTPPAAVVVPPPPGLNPSSATSMHTPIFSAPPPPLVFPPAHPQQPALPAPAPTRSREQTGWATRIGTAADLGRSIAMLKPSVSILKFHRHQSMAMAFVTLSDVSAVHRLLAEHPRLIAGRHMQVEMHENDPCAVFIAWDANTEALEEPELLVHITRQAAATASTLPRTGFSANPSWDAQAAVLPRSRRPSIVIPPPPPPPRSSHHDAHVWPCQQPAAMSKAGARASMDSPGISCMSRGGPPHPPLLGTAACMNGSNNPGSHTVAKGAGVKAMRPAPTLPLGYCSTVQSWGSGNVIDDWTAKAAAVEKPSVLKEDRRPRPEIPAHDAW